MSHIIEVKIHRLLEQIKQDKYKVPEELLTRFSKNTQAALLKHFETPSRKFRLSMSNIGRPSCQLQYEATGKYPTDTNIVRNLYGHIAEEILMFLLYASGIKVIAEQEEVSVDINSTKITGVLDIVLELEPNEYTVWDIKSASNWAFKNKFTSFDKLLQEDTFGYGSQLVLYTIGKRQKLLLQSTSKTGSPDKRVKIGGFIAFDKSSGEIAILQAPKSQEALEQSTIGFCNNQITTVSFTAGGMAKERAKVLPKRCFSDIEEVWRKKPTGNKYLGITCSFCPYKFACWPGLKLLPQISSDSKTPKMLFYTHIKE